MTLEIDQKVIKNWPKREFRIWKLIAVFSKNVAGSQTFMCFKNFCLFLDMSIAYSSMYVPSLENKQWIHLHLKTVLPTPTFSLFLEVLLHLTGRIFWHKNHYKRAEWLSTIAINDIWRRIRFRWRISIYSSNWKSNKWLSN